jgi:hydrogenase nickel incorporation protein HypB
MCSVCGCGQSTIAPAPGAPAVPIRLSGIDWSTATAADVHDHGHSHEPDLDHHHEPEAVRHDHLHFGLGEAGVSVPGFDQGRLVRLERDLLGRNDAQADKNRTRLGHTGTLTLNLVSSPGSGKTTLLVRTLQELAGRLPVAVVEGDQQTSLDADRIRATGAPAVQVNTGKGCHLDADMISRALDTLPELQDGVLFVENVGNLVCPAGFDLGEHAKVAVLSTTEGEDKPLKYPDLFAAARLLLVNKSDLIPYLDVDVDLITENARRVNPDIEVMLVSAKTGEGFESWLAWIEAQRAALG